MKFAVILALVCLTLSVWAKPVSDFNKTLLQEVQKDLKKDDEAFKNAPSRGPASVQEQEERRIEETPKLDKNARQIGPNKW